MEGQEEQITPVDRADMDPGDAAATAAATAATAKKLPKFPCLRCRKAVTKNSKSVQCHQCEQWVHADCEQFAPEFFNILVNPAKFGAVGVFWNCTACLASAARLERLVKSYEGKIRAVEDRVTATEGAITRQDTRMDKIEASVKDKDKEIEKKMARSENYTIEEMEERELRRLNVVFHKVGECPRLAATGMDKLDWDKQSCINIFKELRLDIPMEAIKFCRRLGEKREDPRPMVVGFHLEADRSRLLRAAPRLEHSKFKEVNVGPDLTKRQREKETGMRVEADKRNKSLSEEDKAKNLQWAVVGGRGERRLIKTTARQFSGQRGGGTGRARGGRAPVPTGRSTQGSRGRGTDTEEEGYPQLPPPAGRGGGRINMQTRESMQTREGGRSNNKRRVEEEEMEVEGRPPEKRQQERS